MKKTRQELIQERINAIVPMSEEESRKMYENAMNEPADPMTGDKWELEGNDELWDELKTDEEKQRGW